MPLKYLSDVLNTLKQRVFPKRKSLNDYLDEDEKNDEELEEDEALVPSLSTAPQQTKNKADVLTFDTKKRIFVVKKRCQSVALYNPKNFKISSIKADETITTLQFKQLINGNCHPFSGNWYHAEQTDMGLYCTETGTFYLHNSEKKTIQTIQNKFHNKQHEAIPITGDWLGNGQKSIGVFNNTTSTFFIMTSVKEESEDKVFSFGSPEHKAIPLIGDWNGDGHDTIGLYLPKQGVFFLHNSLDECLSADISFHFGPQNSDLKPLVGDWNGDGQDTIGLYNPEHGLFFLHNTNEGTDKLDYSFNFGPMNKDLYPVVGDWQGKGKSGVGLYDAENFTFYLRQTLTSGPAEMEFKFPKETNPSLPFVISFIAK